jgi:hypothetical protein
MHVLASAGARCNPRRAEVACGPDHSGCARFAHRWLLHQMIDAQPRMSPPDPIFDFIFRCSLEVLQKAI